MTLKSKSSALAVLVHSSKSWFGVLDAWSPSLVSSRHNSLYSLYSKTYKTVALQRLPFMQPSYATLPTTCNENLLVKQPMSNKSMPTFTVDSASLI